MFFGVLVFFFMFYIKSAYQVLKVLKLNKYFPFNKHNKGLICETKSVHFMQIIEISIISQGFLQDNVSKEIH